MNITEPAPYVETPLPPIECACRYPVPCRMYGGRWLCACGWLVGQAGDETPHLVQTTIWVHSGPARGVHSEAATSPPTPRGGGVRI
jgi:hypothetical protein